MVITLKNFPTMNNNDCIDLLRKLVHAPSESFNEEAVAAWVAWWLEQNGIPYTMPQGNVAACATPPDPAKKTLALVAHLDTVPPAQGYTRDPYDPGTSPDIVWGLGSNDDGGSVVAMLATFRHFCKEEKLPFNLLLMLVREEECGGPDGISWLFGPHGPFSLAPGSKDWLPTPDWAIVGEPTGMKAATSERGLVVLDCESIGVSGHAARGEGVNALYIALDDIARLRNYHFTKVSPEMGPVRINATQISAGSAHNVIPDRCRFVVDVRPNECYTPQEIVDELQAVCHSRILPRGLRNRASATPLNSSLRKAIAALDIETYSSPTTSDWTILTCDAIKMGPGDSARSHHADEYILVNEINDAIDRYIAIIKALI